MKLDPVFYVKENKLFKIADNSAVDPASLKRIEIKWSTVEIEEDSYNEEYLAQLREELKSLENEGQFAILVPIVDKSLEKAEETEAFINTFNHTARRVKDCISVAGYELPAELKDIQSFMDTIAIKHAQYVYFSKEKNTSNGSIVLY
ncbi:MAG: hypothetical protein K5681_00110 [Treponema sp.]|nr:hypothetical protein [Treponema sp.]